MFSAVLNRNSKATRLRTASSAGEEIGGDRWNNYLFLFTYDFSESDNLLIRRCKNFIHFRGFYKSFQFHEFDFSDLF